MQTTVEPTRARAIGELLERISSDLSMLADHPVTIEGVSVEERGTRDAGSGSTHLSFRFGAEDGERLHHGTLLVPLPEAIALAGYLMMLPDDAVRERRSADGLDAALKDAMLEIGSFVSGAVDAALRVLESPVSRVRFEGCQGVRDGVRPALVHRDGAPLLVGKAQVRVAQYEPAEWILMIPAGPYLA